MSLRRYIALRRRPQGPLQSEDVIHAEAPLVPLQDGEVLVRVRLLSMDPYLRTAMDERPVVGPAIPLKAVIPGRGIGEVIDSRAPSLKPGQLVVGEVGWQDFSVCGASKLRIIEPAPHPLSWHLGVLGVPGVTALLALELIGKPKEAETVLVSSAAGSVGSAAGQVAKARGCKTIGVTSRGKMDLCRSKFGFDNCIAREAGDLPEQISAITPGLDVVLDNVGDTVLSTVLPLMQSRGRVILCGRLAHYGHSSSRADGSSLFEPILLKQVRVEGFNIRSHLDLFSDALAQLLALSDQGLLQQVDSVVKGLDAAPDALNGLLTGKYIGKVVVEL